MAFWRKAGLVVVVLAGLLLYWELGVLAIGVLFGGFLVLYPTRAVIRPTQRGEWWTHVIPILVFQSGSWK